MGVKLGYRVKDTITGLKGIAIGSTDWLHGCRRFAVQQEELKDGKVIGKVLAEFDGFILFEKIRFGTYTVRKEDSEATVTISREHPVGTISWRKNE